jgi:hypothetical protein
MLYTGQAARSSPGRASSRCRRWYCWRAACLVTPSRRAMSGQPAPSLTAWSTSAASSASASSRAIRARVIFSSTCDADSRAARWAGPGGAAGARCRVWQSALPRWRLPRSPRCCCQTHPMTPARRPLAFLSAAIAVIAAVLAGVLPATVASAATAPAAGTRVGASHPETILPVGGLQRVLAGEGRCEPAPQPGIAAGACVAAEDASSLADRAAQIQSSLTGRTARSTTTAVLSATTPSGESQSIVATSEQSFRAAWLNALKPGEIAVAGPDDAEINALNAARHMGLTPQEIAASRPICLGCQLTLGNAGVSMLSPLKQYPAYGWLP